MSDEKKVSLVCVSYGGTVSILRDLTQDEANRIRNSLLGWNGQRGAGMRVISDGDIKSVEFV